MAVLAIMGTAFLLGGIIIMSRKRMLYALIIIAAVCFTCRYQIARVLVRYGIIESPHYREMVKMFDSMHENTGGIVFLGDSITEFLNVDEYLHAYHIINRGIAGDTTSGVLRRLGGVIALKPRKLFLLIGTNDIGDGAFTVPIARNIREIVSRVQAKSPQTKIYLQGVFPTRHNTSRPNTEIQALNHEIAAIAEDLHCTFIDLYPLLLAPDGGLAEEYTIDGLHLSASAMTKWTAYLVPYLDE